MLWRDSDVVGLGNWAASGTSTGSCRRQRGTHSRAKIDNNKLQMIMQLVLGL